MHSPIAETQPPDPALERDALPDASVRAMVIDEHAPSRVGFASLLEGQPWIARCLVAPDSDAAVPVVARTHPDVVVLDITRNGGFAGSITAAINAAHTGVQILLSSRCRSAPAMAPERVGAVGFLPAGITAEEIIGSVRAAVLGELPSRREAPAPGGGRLELSDREQEILVLLGTGLTNREIGERLHLGPDSIKKSASSLYRKLGVRNRAAAAQRAASVFAVR